MKHFLLILLLAISMGYASIFNEIKMNDTLTEATLADSIAIRKEGFSSRTPLMYSAFLGKNKIIKQLLKKGVSITDSSDGKYNTFGPTGVLHWAIRSGKLSTVKLVAESGAPYYSTGVIYLPLSDEDKKSYSDYAYLGSPLNIAAYNSGEEAIEIVRFLMKHYSPDINERELGKNGTFGYTPLVWAAAQGNLEMVKELISHGADVNYVASNNDASALMYAVLSDNPQILPFLLEKGGDPNLHNNSLKKLTLIQAATYNNKRDAIAPLLKHGANINYYKRANVISYRPVAAVPQAPLLAILMRNEEITNIFLDNLSSTDFKAYSDKMAIAAAGTKNLDLMKRIISMDSTLLQQDTVVDVLVRQLLTSEAGFRTLYSRITLKLPEPIVHKKEEQIIIEGLRYLKGKGVNLTPLFQNDNTSYSGKKTILLLAVNRNYPQLMKYLMSQGAKLDVSVPYYDNILSYAISKKSISAARYIASKGNFLNEKSYLGLSGKDMSYDDFLYFYKKLKKSPELTKASGSYLLSTATRNGFTKEMLELLKKGHKHYSIINPQKGTKSYLYSTALHSGKSETLSALFKAYPPSDSLINTIMRNTLRGPNEENMVTLLESYAFSDSSIVEIFGKCKTKETTEHILNNYSRLLSDSLKTAVFRRTSDYGQEKGKRTAIFISGITLNDSLYYKIISNAVYSSDTVILKELIRQKLPLRIPNYKGNNDYSLLIQLMNKNNNKMLDYYRESGVKFTPQEEYHLYKRVVRDDDTLEMDRLIKQGFTHNNPNASGNHVLRLACSEYSINAANYLLNNNDYSKEIISEGIIGLFQPYFSSSFSSRKEDEQRIYDLAERLFALFPEYESFNRSPSNLPRSLNGKIAKKYIDRIYGKGFGLNAKDRYGNTALHTAVKDYSRQKKLNWVPKLIDWGADINIANDSGHTPLFYAVSGQNIELVTLLLEKGADPNIQDNKGDTPLTKYLFYKKNNSTAYSKYSIESMSKKEVLMKLLLEKGADPYVLNEKKESRVLKKCYDSTTIYLPLLAPYITTNVQNRRGNSYLHLVAEKAKSDSVVKLFLKKELDVNHKNINGITPLQLACSNHNISIKPFLKAGADISVADVFGKTALLRAIDSENIEAVELLIKAGADVNHQSSSGEYPIQLAAGKSLELVYILKGAGADLSVVNTLDENLFMLAIKAGKYETALAFRHWGLNIEAVNRSGRSGSQLIPHYISKRLELRNICDPHFPLPEMLEASRKPLIGEWWLSEVRYMEEKSKRLINSIKYKKRESDHSVEFTAQYFNKHSRYRRVGDKIEFTEGRKRFDKPFIFKDGKLIITTEKYDYDLDDTIITESVYKKR